MFVSVCVCVCACVCMFVGVRFVNGVCVCAVFVGGVWCEMVRSLLVRVSVWGTYCVQVHDGYKRMYMYV